LANRTRKHGMMLKQFVEWGRCSGCSPPVLIISRHRWSVPINAAYKM